MLDFLVLSLPRSGSTWAANWLTGNASLCLHDPLSHRDLNQLAQFSAPGKRAGAACTGLWLWPEWCAANARRVLILERDPQEVARSLAVQGLPLLPAWALEKFAAMTGERVPYSYLFDESTAPEVWAYLLPGLAFDLDRFRLLNEMRVEPHLGKWKPDQAIIDRLFAPR